MSKGKGSPNWQRSVKTKRPLRYLHVSKINPQSAGHTYRVGANARKRAKAVK